MPVPMAPPAKPGDRKVVIVIFVVVLGPYGFRNRRPCSSRISSTTLMGDSRTSSADGGFGRHERHDSAGMRLVTAASGRRSTWRSSTD
jgi:hypothetical protein